METLNDKMIRSVLIGVLSVGFTGIISKSAIAESGLNPDNLSFFEEPLAVDLFGFTLRYNQLIDLPVTFDFKKDDEDFNPRTNFQVNLERQLPNAITIGGTYLGIYDDAEADEYDDRWEVYGSSVWGRLSGGEVNSSVREATRRWRGTGNAELEFDDFLGTLSEEDLGGAYSLRLSAYTLNIGLDEHGNSDFGITYERPNKYIDIKATARYTDGEFKPENSSHVFETEGIGFVTQIEYGSLAADLGLGYERLESGTVKGERKFISAGLHYKIRRLTLSGEGHWGEIDGFDEESYALGARYDLARGLSLNLGYNYAKSDVTLDGLRLQNEDISKFISSLRYEF
jgi:opacity protein-like surface antigen